MSVEQKLPLLHEVTLREAQTMFLDHARQVIFDDHEMRGYYETIKALLAHMVYLHWGSSRAM